MSFINFLSLFIFLFGVTTTIAVQTCNFEFAVPGVGQRCEMEGGLSSNLFDKYRELFGGIEGLKLIINDKNGMSKIIQDGFSRLQREQQIYLGNINKVASDIQAVKQILKIFPISPPDASSRTKRATDPLKALKDGLNLAEQKLIKLTQDFQNNARRQSMTVSASELQILQQDRQLRTVLQKISVLEQNTTALPGSTQNQCSGVSSGSFDTLVKIATMSAKIQATTQIIQARVQDLNTRLQEIDKPMQKRNAEYQTINNYLKRLQSGVSGLTNNVAQLQSNYNTTKNDVTRDLGKVQQDMNNVNTEFSKTYQNFTSTQKDVIAKIAEISQGTATIKQSKASLDQSEKDLTALNPQVANMTAELTAIAQHNLMQLAKIQREENTTFQKLSKDLNQAKRLENTIDMMIKGVDAKVSAMG